MQGKIKRGYVINGAHTNGKFVGFHDVSGDIYIVVDGKH